MIPKDTPNKPKSDEAKTPIRENILLNWIIVFAGLGAIGLVATLLTDAM
jgi:hypothetical protein